MTANLGEALHDVGRREADLYDGALRPDQVHKCLKADPKFSIAFVIVT